MALTNYNKKCSSCGGNKWEYLRELKLWRCRYCDAQVERQEQYDGLYTIKNVVRQVILDSAYRRMEQADRNLSECQKINAQYPGTLIAGICCRMIAVVSGVSLAGQDPRAMLGQIRREYMQLTEESQNMSDDETAVYEFLDSSDAWAVLAMVFDTLGDHQRCEYLLTMTDASQVFSQETNKSLLRFAFKNNRLDLAEQVLANTQNVDMEDAVRLLLELCPEGDAKARLGARLIQQGAIRPGEEEVLEDYLRDGENPATKAALALAACEKELVIHLDVLIRDVLAPTPLPMFRQILTALFKRRLYDGEIELLMNFAAVLKEAERCMAVIDAIAEAGQFVPLSVRQAQGFLFDTGTVVEMRLEMYQRLRRFTTAERTWESVAGAYLCQSTESARNRGMVLKALCENVTSVPAKDFEQYVLQCNVDGQQKVDYIRMILALPNMNTSFFRELAGKYLQDNQDAPEYRAAIFHQLIACGIVIDGASLVEYVCNSEDTPDARVELTQLALKNGTALRADALSIYLERCADQFAPELFALLYRENCSISPKALENYLLRSNESFELRLKNGAVLAKHTGLPFGSGSCTIDYLGCRIQCSLAQAYILTTKDDADSAARMVNCMVESGTKLATPIQVNGQTKKFSRFVQEKRRQLSPATDLLCQDFKLFPLFF